jgi:hypothetical protein
MAIRHFTIHHNKYLKIQIVLSLGRGPVIEGLEGTLMKSVGFLKYNN